MYEITISYKLELSFNKIMSALKVLIRKIIKLLVIIMIITIMIIY